MDSDITVRTLAKSREDFREVLTKTYLDSNMKRF